LETTLTRFEKRRHVVPGTRKRAVYGLLDTVRSRVADSAQDCRLRLQATPAFADHDIAEVERFCSILRFQKPGPGEDEAERTECDEKMLVNVREVFMCVVRADYWEQIEHHHIPSHGDAALSLIASTDVAMDHVDQPLNDWASLIDACTPSASQLRMMARLDKFLPDSVNWDDAILRKIIFGKKEDSVYITKAFVHAHKVAQEKVAAFFGETAEADSPEECKVIEESKVQVAFAMRMLETISPVLLKSVVSKQVAGILLGSQADDIKHLQKEGMLTPKEASEMIQQVTKDLTEMGHARKATASQFSKMADHKEHLSFRRPSGALVAPEPEGGVTPPG
jgi:hypothetical protein